MDYISKIRKLLALSNSKNEHEAKAALLKARKLMYKHKVSEESLRVDNEVITKDTQWSFTSRTNSWMDGMAALLGEKYCCRPYIRREYHKKSRTIGFYGFPEDVQTCIIAFDYAIQTVLSGCDDIKMAAHRSKKEIGAVCNGYGYGFLKGLDDAFKQQDYKGRLDLILQIPSEVEEYGKENFDKAKPTKTTNVLMDKWEEGISDGRRFGTVRKLQNSLPGI